MITRHMRATAVVASVSLLLASCGGGDSGNASNPNPQPAPTNGRVYSDPATNVFLTQDNVRTVIGQAVAEAQARGQKATIAVVDRVGNVLAVYQMAGLSPTDTVDIPKAPDGSMQDAQGLAVPATAAAIAKAITGAYLSSSGNAFSTRTASMIVQPHFPPSPSASNLPSGPLFGVQFSQLPCSDLNARFATPPYTGVSNAFLSETAGPKRSPLGLSADPGGFPLYINGVVVGGVGVIADGIYGFDPDAQNVDSDTDEALALAATRGFEAPEGIRANRIDVGVSLRYSDVGYGQLPTRTLVDIESAATGQYIRVPGYFDQGVPIIGPVVVPPSTYGPKSGTPYGVTSSGYRPAGSDFSDPDAYVLTFEDGTNRFPARTASDGTGAMSQSEVAAILEEAFKVLKRERAAIREPDGSRSQVTISVVDRNGAVLGIVRSPDAPIFGTDVSLQKARTAAFFSSADAAAQIDAQPALKTYMDAARAFFARQDAFAGWGFAFGDRSIGSIARPLFPDGQPGTINGPFSVPITKFNPFATGLQSGLIIGNLATELTNPAAQGETCTFTPRLGNGIQIFPGSVPIYRGGTLVGGIGVSGDGVDQDDMVGYLGLHNASLRLNNGLGNAPVAIRSNRLSPPAAGGSFLFYVRCPNAPFVDSNEQNPCPDLPR